MKTSVALVAVLLSCLALTLEAVSRPAGLEPRATSVPEPVVLTPHATPAVAPDIRIVDLKGLDAALAKYRGRGVLLNFWAIWCEPCVAELPELLEVGRQFRAENGVVVTVSYDLMLPDVTSSQVLEQMRAFVSERKIDAPVLVYNAPDYDAINKRFGLPGPVPATVAIDSGGAIVDRQAGRAGKVRFVQMMRKAVGRARVPRPRGGPQPRP